MTNDICVRLAASLKYDVINGDSGERAILVSQIREAISTIRSLQNEIKTTYDNHMKALVEQRKTLTKESDDLREKLELVQHEAAEEINRLLNIVNKSENITSKLEWLKGQGCHPSIYRRGDLWRVHINMAGNWWEEHESLSKAVNMAIDTWVKGGKMMDGLASQDI